jgi:hypothetical protein
MSTEQITMQLLLGIRDHQHQQMAALQDIVDRQDESIRLLRGIGKLLRDKPSKPVRTWALPQGALWAGLQYLAMLAAVIYMLKGGDLGKLAALVKVLGPL